MLVRHILPVFAKIENPGQVTTGMRRVMPRMAVRIGWVCALSAFAANLCGCLSNAPFQPMSGSAVLPSEHFLSSRPAAFDTPMSYIVPSPTDQPSNPASISVVPVSAPFGGSNTTADPETVPGETRNAATVRDLRHIYGRTAQSDDRDRNPIIVIPGVLGSRLVDPQSGRVVWGEFGGDGINPSTSGGAQLIALPMSPGQPLVSLTDGVTPSGTLDALEIRVLGIPFQINAYRDLLTALGVGGYHDSQTKLSNIDYRDQNYSSFQFAYDWRRDNVENAQSLHRFILEKKAYVESERRQRYGNNIEPVRFDIVAHSMGGLVARYYLQYGDADLPADGSTPVATWAGAQHVERLVLIATPNAGSLDTIANLIHGETLSRFLPHYQAAILGTMPALYQLLPRSRQNPVIAEGDRRGIEIMDPQAWKLFRWGLLDPRQHHVLKELLPGVDDPNLRQQIAYDHVAKCLKRAQTFHAALDVTSQPPSGTTIHLIAGDANPTITQYRVDNRGALTVTAWQPGDGRVSRASALMDERYSTGVKWTPRLITPVKWSSVNFLAADHLGLTSDPGFTDNILYLLLESPR